MTHSWQKMPDSGEKMPHLGQKMPHPRAKHDAPAAKDAARRRNFAGPWGSFAALAAKDNASGHRLNPAFEILAWNQVNDLNAVGKEPEQQSKVDPDALANDIRTALQPLGAAECGRIASGKPSEHDHGAARDVMRKLAQPLLEISREFDEADRMVHR